VLYPTYNAPSLLLTSSLDKNGLTYGHLAHSLWLIFGSQGHGNGTLSSSVVIPLDRQCILGSGGTRSLAV